MPWQFNEATRNGWLDLIETNLGPSARFQAYSGSVPANTAAAATGTLLVNMVLPADFMANASGGIKTLSGTWQANALADGNIGYVRLVNNAGSLCVAQGIATRRWQIATSAVAAANSNVLTFASTTGVAVGMNVTGAGVPDLATVLAVTSTTVTLSHALPAGVASGVTISFNGDVWFDNLNVATGQQVTVNSFQWTALGA